MDKTLNVHTLNVRSIAQIMKRNTLFDWLKENCPGIIFLQETHSTADSNWKDEWPVEISICIHLSTNCRVNGRIDSEM